VPEELYRYATDADALENLVGRPEFRAERDRLTSMLEEWMVRTRDPMLEVFRARHDPAAREAFMTKVEAEATARQAASPRAGKKGGKKNAAKKSP
jgi:N-sulfoglucosamine sulfohydrolase